MADEGPRQEDLGGAEVTREARPARGPLRIWLVLFFIPVISVLSTAMGLQQHNMVGFILGGTATVLWVFTLNRVLKRRKKWKVQNGK